MLTSMGKYCLPHRCPFVLSFIPYAPQGRCQHILSHQMDPWKIVWLYSSVVSEPKIRHGTNMESSISEISRLSVELTASKFLSAKITALEDQTVHNADIKAGLNSTRPLTMRNTAGSLKAVQRAKINLVNTTSSESAAQSYRGRSH